MVKISCNMDRKSKDKDGYCVAEIQVEIKGDGNLVANEVRVIITELDNKLGEDLFAEILDDWLRKAFNNVY